MADEASPISYEDLALIEDDFEEIDNQIIRTQYEISKPAYAKRATAVSQIPHFWPLVLEQAPPEIDRYIQTADSRIFADSLLSLEVRRPDLDASTKTGSPRSLSIKFAFAANDDFSDTTLEKTFWYRRARDGWTGLVSEPVKIHWKKGRDLTEGLTDGAVALWAARRKVGDMRNTSVPEYTALKEKVEHWNGANTSFFTWFGWISGRRWVSAEESAEANEEYRAKKEARKRGEKVELEGALEEGADDIDVEVHEEGEDLAISFADDLWPNAIKFFVQAQEAEEMLSDVDFEEDEDDEDDEDGDEPVDIRSLVQDKSNGQERGASGSSGPPLKKQKH